MKYIQIYERFKSVEFNTYSKILNKILNKIAEPSNGYKCLISKKGFDKSTLSSNSKCYWILCEFTAKNGMEASNNREIYNIFIKEKKEQLEKFEEVDRVFYEAKGRTAPFGPNSKNCIYKKPKERVYELKIYLTEEAANEIELEYDIHQSVKKYNL